MAEVKKIETKIGGHFLIQIDDEYGRVYVNEEETDQLIKDLIKAKKEIWQKPTT